MTLRSMWVLTGSNSRHNRVAYFGRSNTLLEDVVRDMHQHQKLDCLDEAVYSCNGLTPLDLE